MTTHCSHARSNQTKTVNAMGIWYAYCCGEPAVSSPSCSRLPKQQTREVVDRHATLGKTLQTLTVQRLRAGFPADLGAGQSLRLIVSPK